MANSPNRGLIKNLNFRILFFGILTLSALNGYAQSLHYLVNPDYTIKKEWESVSKINILDENLQESSPGFMLQKFKFYGIDAKQQRIKSITSKNSYFEFDSTGNLRYADFGAKIRKGTYPLIRTYNMFVEFKYNNLGNLIHFQGSTDLGSGGGQSNKNFIYDSLNRIIGLEDTFIDGYKAYTQYYYDKRNNVTRVATYYDYEKSPVQDSIRKIEQESVKKFLYSSFDDSLRIKKEIKGEVKKTDDDGCFYSYDSSNRMVKRVCDGRTNDSIFYYNDSIIRYNFSPGYSSISEGQTPASINKFIYFIENNKIVKITRGNDLLLTRKFDDKNNVVEETTLYYDHSRLNSIHKVVYEYDAKGKLSFLHMESKPHYAGHRATLNEIFFYNDKGMLICYEYENIYEDKEMAKAFNQKKKKYKIKYSYY